MRYKENTAADILAMAKDELPDGGQSGRSIVMRQQDGDIKKQDYIDSLEKLLKDCRNEIRRLQNVITGDPTIALRKRGIGAKQVTHYFDPNVMAKNIVVVVTEREEDNSRESLIDLIAQKVLAELDKEQ